MNLLSIPDSDSAEFAHLRDDVRAEVRAYQGAVGRLLALNGKAKKGALKMAIIAEAREIGVSPRTLSNKYYDYRSGVTRKTPFTTRTFPPQDWRVFVNYAKQEPAAQQLPNEFIDLLWKPICGLFAPRVVHKSKTARRSFQRNAKAAHRFLMRGYHRRRWVFAGQKIEGYVPGYQEFPLPTGKGIPAGWSYENLRNYFPSRFETVAIGEGLGKAIGLHFPKVLHTRVGLWPGSHFSFDDVQRDVKGLLISRNQIVVPQELGCMEILSADRFLVHRRPIFERDDGVKDHIKEREMRFVVAAWGRHTGYNAERGTELITELGMAAIRPPLAEFLYEHSHGMVRVRGAGITGREQALKGYWGRGGGNPRHKALLESHHNLLHNEAAFLPAPTGHDRQPPEWLFGLEAVTQDVCRSLARMLQDPNPAVQERAGLLFAPMCEWWQLLELLTQIDEFIAWRTDHRIEGWEKCGFTTVDYRRDITQDKWLSGRELLELPVEERRLIESAALGDARFRNPRRLAPREVMMRGWNELTQFPDHVIALMFADDSLGEDLREPRRLNAEGQFEVSDQLAGPDRMVFAGKIRTAQGEVIPLRETESYGTVLNPWDAAHLWIYDRNGGYLGTAPRIERLCLSDDHTHVLGQREHELKTLLTPLRDRSASASRELVLLQEHNERVANGAAVTQEEKRAARKQDRTQQSAARFGEILREISGEKNPTAEIADNAEREPNEEIEIW